MIYLDIKTISSLSEAGIIEYSNSLIENEDCNAEIETYLLNISRNTYFFSDDLVLSYVRHFLIENYENISYSFYTNKFCRESDLIILNYRFNELSYSIAVPKSFKEYFEHDAVMLESGEQVDMGDI